jgi:PAS domain S-box-containing protein
MNHKINSDLMTLIHENTEDYNLEVTEKTFEELYSKAGILYFLLDPQAGILSCNVTVEEKFGLARKDLVGKKFLSLFPDQCVAAVETALHLCYHKGYVKDISSRMTAEGGRLLSVRLNGLAQADPGGNLETVRLYVQDVSELDQNKRENKFLIQVFSKMQSHKEADRKTKEMLNDVQVFSESQGIGLFLQEREGQPLNLVTWNDADVASPYGNDFRKWRSETWLRTIDAARGCAAASFTPSGSFWTCSLSDLMLEVAGMEDKEAWSSLSCFESVGVIRIAEETGRNSVLVITHRDKRRWDEKAVLFMEAVAAVFGQRQPGTQTQSQTKRAIAPPVDVILDVPFIGTLILQDGRIERANAWMESWTGYSEAELKEKSAYELLAPECAVGFQEWCSVMGDLGSGHYGKELVVLAKDGQQKSVYGAVFRNAENGRRNEIWHWTPKPEESKAHEQLLHAKRMEYLGMLSGSLVLDFNNLLSCIIGYTSLLSEEIPKDSPHYEDLQQISKTAQKATELTSRLLASAKGTPYIMENLDVNELVKEVAAYLSKTMKKNIVIRAEMEPRLERIKADANEIQQAILQIALNARDAMPGGGKLFFQTRTYQVGEADAHLHSGSRPGKYVQIAISDTGTGMGPEVKDRLLKPSSAQPPGRSGKGFGLTMVKQIVARHNGFLSVFSEGGKGTLFKIHFPVEEKKRGASALSGGKPALGKETILLVDDEPGLRETARKMLTRYGYKVLSTDNGTEAVAVYKKYIDRIQLVILDLGVPGMEIHKVLTWFKKLNPKVKILASVGASEGEAVEDTIGRSVSGFIEKPYQLRPLLESIRNVLNA